MLARPRFGEHPALTMDLMLRGRRALVTGASRGLGRAIALALAREGCAVAAVARPSEALDALVAELPDVGRAHVAIPTDLMQDDAPDAVVRGLEPGTALDVIVHNFGGSLRVTDPLASEGDYARVWRANVGVAIGINARTLPGMRARGFGRVVHVSSVSATNHSGYVPYVAAKAALNGYVAALGRELAGTGVVVSAMGPGPIAVPGRYLTELQRQGGDRWDEYCRNHLASGRLAQPEDLVPFLMLLCSPLASYAAGTVVDVGGGSH